MMGMAAIKAIPFALPYINQPKVLGHYTEAMEIGPTNCRNNSTGGFPLQAPLAKSISLKHLSLGEVITWLPLPTQENMLKGLEEQIERYVERAICFRET
jgi:hypothetical protein